MFHEFKTKPHKKVGKPRLQRDRCTAGGCDLWATVWEKGWSTCGGGGVGDGSPE